MRKKDKEKVLELLRNGPLSERTLRATLNRQRSWICRYTRLQFISSMETLKEVNMYFVNGIYMMFCLKGEANDRPPN
jgi:hypothetical protein